MARTLGICFSLVEAKEAKALQYWPIGSRPLRNTVKHPFLILLAQAIGT